MSDTDEDFAENSAPSLAVSFDNFELPELMLATLAREGLITPTPIQKMSIPPLLKGKDLIGLAQTGTGKTAAFLLPIMTQLGYGSAVRAGQPPKALILAPTRELANQIEQNVRKLSADLNIRHLAVFGGARYDAQIRSLRRGVDIVVATPGRLEDLMDRGAFDPSGITHFVLDEADHMLDLGFYPPIKRIASSLPHKRQTMLFSATMPPEIEKLANEFLTNPVYIKAPQTGITADKVTQHVTLMAESDKRDRLCDILNEKNTGQTLIFVRTKRRADTLAKFMSVRGFAVDALHGDMRQTLRQKVLRNFRSGDLRALIATDVAARGIDVAGLSHVINFDLTDTPEAYVHRIGRTGRAGLGGLAVSFCAPDEQHKLGAIISVVGARVELFDLDGTVVTDFKSGNAPQRSRRRPSQGPKHSFSNRDGRTRTTRDGDRRNTRNNNRPARTEKSSGDKKSFDKTGLGGNLHAVANHIAATNRPIQKVNTLFGPIVTRDQAVMAGQHARISLLVRSHLVKKLRRTNLLAMMGSQVMNAHPKKAGKKARRPLHMAKRNLSAVSQSSKSGPTLAISHPQRLTDQTSQKSGTLRRPTIPKKRNSRKSNASPQGGQGTLKRRR